jgi:hypothetical protein
MDVLDHVYLGGPSASVGRSMNEALEEASQRRLGLLPPPRQAAAQSTNPIGLNQASKGGYCPFLQGGGFSQPTQDQQKSSQGSSSGGYSASAPAPVSYTAPATSTPPVTSKPSPATISY